MYFKVILYNFFEESALGKLEKYLKDKDEHKKWDSKYAPLIREVSETVCFHLQTSEALLSGFGSSNACMLPLLGQDTSSGLWTIPIAAKESWFVPSNPTC